MKALRLGSWFPCILLAASCGGDSSGPDGGAPSSIEFATPALSLAIGQTTTLAATVVDERGRVMAGQTIAWSSSDTTRVVIDVLGAARGVRAGAATITARSGAISRTLPTTVLEPHLNVEESRSVTGRIGAGGGTVSATGGNGVHYTLTVPARALRDEADITLTPVASIGNLELVGGLAAGVRLRPDGLRFLVPVTVTAELPAAPAANSLIGLHLSDDGKSVAPDLMQVNGRELRFTLAHFSGAGATSVANAAVLAGAVPHSGTAEQEARQRLAAITGPGNPASPNVIVLEIIQTLRAWYTAGIRPGLAPPPANDEALFIALSDRGVWLASMNLFGMPQAQQIRAALASEIAEAESLAATALQTGVQRGNAECNAAQDLQGALNAMFWQSLAEELALTNGTGLDRASVLAGLCAQIEYVTTSLPADLDPGQPAELRVVAGFSIGNGAPVFSPGLRIVVTPGGATTTMPVTIRTDATGTATMTLTPDGSADLSADLDACIDVAVTADLGLANVCASDSITRAVGPFYSNDFLGAAGAEWSVQTVTQSPSGQRFLGEFQNRVVTLTLNQIPVHTRLRIEFDFYAIGTWDGGHSGDGPDVFTISVQNGAELQATSFSNVTQPGYEQAYPGNHPAAGMAPGTGATTNVLGYPPNNNDPSKFLGDAVYPLAYTFDHTAGSIVLVFRVSAYTTAPDDERWGVDNVRVRIVP